MRKILIIGATSTIAEATARLFAQKGDRLFLLARNSERLETLSQDLSIRGAESVSYEPFDVNDFNKHETMISAAISSMHGIDIALIAHGTLPDQKACQKDINLALRELNTNAISTISLLSHLANKLEEAKHGCIACITSVAGDRGRQSNYVYGAAKGAVSIFLQGLRNRLTKSGAHVITIKPGFVDTPMTSRFKKGVLWAHPERIALAINSAIDKRRDIVYTPWYWFWIMLVVRVVPEKFYKRLTL